MYMKWDYERTEYPSIGQYWRNTSLRNVGVKTKEAAITPTLIEGSESLPSHEA